MRNKFNNILLGLLWFSVSTLGACFWFNSHYGFDIFSNAHWKHLAYMQAAQQPVKFSFYVSMIFSIIITIGGMYVLLRPRFRKITLPIRDTNSETKPVTHTVATTQTPAPTNTISEAGLTRPARLNIGTYVTAPVGPAPVTQTPVIPATAPVTAPTLQFTPPAKNKTVDDAITLQMQEIFESTGYKNLQPPRISGLQTSVLALGTDENLWLGATDIETSTLAAAIDVMTQIFIETLEDIPIHIHGFVVNAHDAEAPASDNILTFATLDDLREYMTTHQNTPLPADEAENFDAFVNYITTVIDYLRTQ